MEALRVALQLSPEVILRDMNQLRQMGHEIESAPAYGFRLCQVEAKLTSELLEHDLQTKRVGRKVLVYDSTDSSIDAAWHYVSQTDNDGLAVFAEYQQCGRGRLARKWSAPKGSSILCSVLFLDGSLLTGQKLTLMAGVSTAEVVDELYSLPVRIKWPNDVIVNGRKLAGIMVESKKLNKGFAYVVGIGINCLQSEEDFPPELRKSAVSLRQLTDEPIDRLELGQQLLRRLDLWLWNIENNQTDQLHEEFVRRCDDLGRRISLEFDGRCYTGRVVDVSIEQGLILQLDDGKVHIFDPAITTVIP